MQTKYLVASHANRDLDLYKVNGDNVYYVVPTQESITVDGVVIEDVFLRELNALYLSMQQVKEEFVFFQQYRRFFAFEDENKEALIQEDFLTQEKIEKYHICQYDFDDSADVILPFLKDVKNFGYKNVDEYMTAYENKYGTDRFNIFCEKLIEDGLFSEKDITSVLKQEKLNDLCMFGMKKDLFCKFFLRVFSVLANVHKELDRSLDPYLRMHDYSRWFSFALQVLALRDAQLKVKYYPVVQFESTIRDKEWKPAFAENNIALVLSSSDFYVIYLSAMLESIMINASAQFNYDITILESGITKENKTILKNMKKGRDNVSIRFYNVKSKMAGVKLKAGGHISVETYYRLLIPYIFKNYRKILFLDSDMTTHADVAELFNMDISGYMVAATHDQCIAAFCNGSDKTFLPYCKKQLGIENYWDYFQAGVMLLNLERMREKYTQEDIFEIATKRQYRYVDQDIMNVLCKGEVKHLPLVWNCFPDMGDYIYDYMPYYLLQEYKEARKNPKICHHTGPVKPWQELFADTFMMDKFWSMSSRTPYFEQVFTRTVHGLIQQYFAEYKIMRPGRRILRCIKNRMVIPFGMLFVKPDSKLYKKIKRSYYKFRGVEIPTWEMAKEEEEE